MRMNTNEDIVACNADVYASYPDASSFEYKIW